MTEVDPVFVFADDGLHVFPSRAHLLGYVEWQDVEDGVYKAVFTIDGRVVELRSDDRQVEATLTDRSAVDDLRMRLSAVERLESDHGDLRAVANEELRGDWEARWPKRPRWIDRRLHGAGPPQI